MLDQPRTAIVTGAAKRVGAVIAASLLAEEWSVVAHAHHDGGDVPEGATKVVAELGGTASAGVIFDAAARSPRSPAGEQCGALRP